MFCFGGQNKDFLQTNELITMIYHDKTSKCYYKIVQILLNMFFLSFSLVFLCLIKLIKFIVLQNCYIYFPHATNFSNQMGLLIVNFIYFSLFFLLRNVSLTFTNMK